MTVRAKGSVKGVLLGLLLGALAFSAAGAFAAEESYILKEGRVYRVSAGKETLLEDEEPGRNSTDKGLYSWILVDPELNEAMKGSESGIYFFLGEDGKLAGFMPLEAAGFSELQFSPDGEKFLVSWGADAVQELSLYVFDGFVRKALFTALGPCAWLDPHRFVFTRDETGKGSRGKAVEQQEGWLSVALYDSALKELTVLREATETQDYIIRFGIGHNYINNNFKSRVKKCAAKDCEHGSLTIEGKFVQESVKKYFDLELENRSVMDSDPPYFFDRISSTAGSTTSRARTARPCTTPR